ncbi:CHAT domain-containing protein [Corallococcus sp. M34]|uniref:CHAT domain-containing protein n=1 Tax=Citreicoccus inhibens TaxID=2849499 RepID=UPI001C221E63|nr:CHAT domain-containing protein [Citreicoccus inhibens]MBU8898700.1 CHAT domain-containing protein [Citreicoccus inhibens]
MAGKQAEPRNVAGRAGGARWALSLGVLLGLGFWGLSWRKLGGQRDAPELWRASEPTRPLEARLSVPAADVYRRYAPPHGPTSDTMPVPLRALARLESRDDSLAIAAAYLTHGDIEQALAHLRRTPASLARDNDRAAAALMGGHLDEALTLLDAVLEEEPGHPQALWNRGLVLRELGLPLMAAQSFEALAAKAEPGWSDEARQLATLLRTRLRERAQAWSVTHEALIARLTRPSAPVPVEAARRFPGHARELFYELVRAAPDARAVQALLPLAAELDHVSGTELLTEHVREAAQRDFSKRGALAREYAQLALDKHPSPESFVKRLRAADVPDLLLGALLHNPLLAENLEELEALVRDSRDPWLRLRVEEEAARLEDLAGQGLRASQRLREALMSCRASKLPLRCLDLMAQMSLRATTANRLSEAEEFARASWTEATALGEWEREELALYMLGNAARFQVRIAVARAVLSEALAREPESCRMRTALHRIQASLALMRLRPREARRELEDALSCGQPPGLLGAWILADLARLEPRPTDEPRLRDALARVSPASESPGRRVLATLIQGRFQVERDWRAGQATLRRAISEAEPLLAIDADARDARAVAYQTLAVSAGKAGAFSEALSIIAEGLHVQIPDGCVVAASVEAERTVAVVRGADGQVRGHFDAARRAPLPDDLSGLVPADLVSRLQDCTRVAVLAAPPLDTRAGLLPSHLAWSYHVGPGERVAAPARPPLRLIVANVDTPPSLRLPRLPAWEPEAPTVPHAVELTGAQATPERVLTDMEDATDIEIHAHGMVDRSLSDATVIALAPDPGGRYALTAEALRRIHLNGAPIVLLGACGAARLPPILHQTSSLPQAFVASGARAVFAATQDIPDASGRFFRDVRERILAGAEPALALRDERLHWLQESPDAQWVDTVLLYQ